MKVTIHEFEHGHLTIEIEGETEKEKRDLHRKSNTEDLEAEIKDVFESADGTS